MYSCPCARGCLAVAFSATYLDIGKSSTPRFKMHGNRHYSTYTARNDCPDCRSVKIKLTGGCTYKCSDIKHDVRYSILMLDYSPSNQISSSISFADALLEGSNCNILCTSLPTLSISS